MKRLLVASLALALLVPACAFAQSAFNGTWKMNPTTVHQSGKAMVIHLKDGMYRCNCTPPISVKADGQDHAVTGHPDFDTVAIKVLNDRSIQETDKKDGKVVHQSTFTVAADGKTATNEFTNHTPSGSFSAKAIEDRVAKGTPGENAVAGSWRLGHVVSASGGMMADTYEVTGNDISYKTPSGDSYTATINGKAVPYMSGGKQGGTVAVKRMGKDTLRETYAKDGKVTLTSTMTVSANGKTMKTSNHNFRTGRTMTWVNDKQ